MEAWREELYHHGIQGQKWGVQNGPPYPLDSDQRTTEEKRKNGAESQSAKEKYGDNNSSSSGKKSVSSMSNAELQAAINRTSNEIRYKQLLAEKNISRPKGNKILREGIGVAKNATSIAGNVSKLLDKDDLGTALAGVSKAFGGASNAVDAMDKLSSRAYERKVAEFKASIDLSHMSDIELANAVNRLSAEMTYERLTNNNAMVDAGKDRIYNLLQTSNAALQIGSSATNIAAGIKQTVKAVKTDKSSKDDTNKEESKKEESKKEKTKTESKKEQKQKTESKKEQKQKTESKQEQKAKGPERYEGTVEGEGVSSKSEKTRNSKVVNGKWRDIDIDDIPESFSTAGKSYVDEILALPMLDYSEERKGA